MRRIIIILLLLYCATSLAQYDNETVYKYIDNCKELAVESMQKSKIPACIKLAQAIFATNAGTNNIARNANNHFGILCNEKYTGEKYYDSSDKNNSCYRKYSSVENSYADHSRFLTERSRYNKLFSLSITDYKGWANGLQEAGYSINPDYGEQLIAIIETYYLYLYDSPENLNANKSSKEIVQAMSNKSHDTIKRDTIIESGIEVIIERKAKPQPVCKSDSIVTVEKKELPVEAKIFTAKEMEYKPAYYPYTSRTVYSNNKIKFTIAIKGDTYEKIAQEVKITESNLRLYNDIFDDLIEPVAGEVVYIQYKNKKSPVAYHTIERGETMRYIAQKYAVPLKLIFMRNSYQMSEFSVGNIICISCKK